MASDNEASVSTLNSSQSLERVLRWVRSSNDLLVLSLALFYQFYSQQVVSFDFLKILYVMASLSFVYHLVVAQFFDFILRFPLLALFSCLVDVVWIASLQSLIQLPLSIPLLMNVIVISWAGLALGMRDGFLVAAWSSLSVALSFWFSTELPTLSSLFLIFLQMITFAGVAGLSGLLSDQLESQGITLDTMKKLNSLILQTIPSGLITFRPDLQIIRANAKAHELLEEPLEGKKISEIFVDEAAALGGLAGGAKFHRKELKWQNQKVFDVRVLPQGDELNRTYLMVFDDLTEIQRLEQISRRNEKMAAVGQLAAGIAHEIRNPLASISGSLELMSPQAFSDEDKKLRGIALKEIQRLNGLISEFLDFAKPFELSLKPISFSKLLHEWTQALKVDPRFQKIRLEENIQPNLEIVGVEEKLKQVFLNLAINARDAMDGRSDSTLTVRLLDEGPFTVLEVSDNGAGMDPEVARRVFEPFYTTKPKGTGLGLALVHKILEGHGATIEVQSQKGIGTTIKVSFNRRKTFGT